MTLSVFLPASQPQTARKETHMKRIIGVALLALALCLSTAIASPWIQIEDGGVDYEDTDLESAYIGLSMADDRLVVTIDDAAFDGALPSIAFAVPDLPDREDFFGTKINATIRDISEIRWAGQNDDLVSAAYLVGFEVTHESVSMDDLLAAYERAFSEMGFTAEVSTTATPSVRLATYSNGSTAASARFHAQKGDVVVELRTH